MFFLKNIFIIKSFFFIFFRTIFIYFLNFQKIQKTISRIKLLSLICVPAPTKHHAELHQLCNMLKVTSIFEISLITHPPLIPHSYIIHPSITHPSLIQHSSITHPSLIHHSPITHPSLTHHSSITHPPLIHPPSITHPFPIHHSFTTHPSLIHQSSTTHPSLIHFSFLTHASSFIPHLFSSSYANFRPSYKSFSLISQDLLPTKSLPFASTMHFTSPNQPSQSINNPSTFFFLNLSSVFRLQSYTTSLAISSSINHFSVCKHC